MSELYFRIGEAEGFTSKKLADKKEGYATPLRELLQNALDASNDKGNEKCKVNIYIEKLKISDVPHIEEYKQTLEQAIKFQQQVGSYRDNSKNTVNAIKESLNQEYLDVLLFIDNGIGMSPQILNGLIGERSVKDSESSGGSFGVGHLSSYFLSSLRYVLYASKYKDDNDNIQNLFSGSPILAGFEDEEEIERSSVGRILNNKPENDKKPNFNYPTKFPAFIDSKINTLNGTGSMIGILGLNESWNKEENYAIVSNFFYAILKEKLKINITHNHMPVEIDKTDIDRILEKNKDKKIAQGDSILSGNDTYQAWLNVSDEKTKQEIDLSNNDKVCVHIKNNIETNSHVVLIRNGMLIARHDNMLSIDLNNLRKNENFEPFSIVINIDEKCPILHKLTKGAENPYHNKLERKRLLIEDEKQLKVLLKELSENVKYYLEKRNRSGSLIMMPELEIPNKAEEKGQNYRKPITQKTKAKHSESNPNQPIHIKPTHRGKNRPAPTIANRSLTSRNALRLRDNGDTLECEMQIKPQEISEKDEVYFSISIATDTDNNFADSALKIEELSLNGKSLPISDDNSTQIKLGKLIPKQIYNIKAIIKKPDKVKGIGIALKPFLGLKQEKDNEQ